MATFWRRRRPVACALALGSTPFLSSSRVADNEVPSSLFRNDRGGREERGNRKTSRIWPVGLGGTVGLVGEIQSSPSSLRRPPRFSFGTLPRYANNAYSTPIHCNGLLRSSLPVPWDRQGERWRRGHYEGRRKRERILLWSRNRPPMRAVVSLLKRGQNFPLQVSTWNCT